MRKPCAGVRPTWDGREVRAWRLYADGLGERRGPLNLLGAARFPALGTLERGELGTGDAGERGGGTGTESTTGAAGLEMARRGNTWPQRRRSRQPGLYGGEVGTKLGSIWL